MMAKHSSEPCGMQVVSVVEAQRAEGISRSQREAWPALFGFVSAQSTESASLQKFQSSS